MTIRTALFEELRDDAGVNALVGSGSAARIYPLTAPSSAALPRITYQKLGNEHIRSSTVTAGLARSRFQINCWADTATGADALAETVREALDHFQHQTLGTTNTAEVRGMFLENETEDYEAPETGDEVGVYSVKMDFEIWYAETVPSH